MDASPIIIVCAHDLISDTIAKYEISNESTVKNYTIVLVLHNVNGTAWFSSRW